MSGGRAHPDFGPREVTSDVFTFDPWIGCLWGQSCRFCYVPNLMANSYQGGREGYWFNEWGRWLIPKSDIAARLDKLLIGAQGETRSRYRNAFVFMSPKTDPFLPLERTLKVAQNVLQVFRRSDVFLMCQTRSASVIDDPKILESIVNMASRGRVGVSFSISTDLEVQQRKFERGGLSSPIRLGVMRRLRASGVFVSAAISPLLPYSSEFAHKIVDAADHASIQQLKSSRSGATTPGHVLDEVRNDPAHQRDLADRLSGELSIADATDRFAWGIDSKGFIGGFLAAKRFYSRKGS